MSGTHSHRRPPAPRRARWDGAARSLFSGVPRYGTLTIVFLQLTTLVAQLGAAYVIVAGQRQAHAETTEPRTTVRVIPGPTITAQPPIRREARR